MRHKLRLLGLLICAVLPSVLSRPIYRYVYGYFIGRRVSIGFSVIDAGECEIGDDVRIGHLNIFTGTRRISIGEHTRIGVLNVIRGGDTVSIGRYCEILRLNEINSIPDPLISNVANPEFIMGDGTVVTTSHKIDFTDRVELGKCVILGGRNSSIWTHNRQSTEPVRIGPYCYLGSELRIAPGAEIPNNCVVGIGSVIIGRIEGEYQLIAGVPAKPVKPLDDNGKRLTVHKTRPDLPDDI